MKNNKNKNADNNVYDHEVIARAISFAAVSHCGMFRKGTHTPYIVHPMEAAVIVSTMTSNPEIIAAAVLHDVIEDTPVTIEDLRKEFSAEICDMVAAESENKREHLPAADTWAVRKQETLEKLSGASIKAKMIALSDKLSNLRSIKRDYNKIGDKLWDRFNQKDPKEQAKYYRSFKNATVELEGYETWQEFANLVEEVFKSY